MTAHSRDEFLEDGLQRGRLLGRHFGVLEPQHGGQHAVDGVQHLHRAISDEHLRLHGSLEEVVVRREVAVEQRHRLDHHDVILVVRQVLITKHESWHVIK